MLLDSESSSLPKFEGLCTDLAKTQNNSSTQIISPSITSEASTSFFSLSQHYSHSQHPLSTPLHLAALCDHDLTSRQNLSEVAIMSAEAQRHNIDAGHREAQLLWRAWRTIHQMVRDRGYELLDEEIDISFEDFKHKFGEGGHVRYLASHLPTSTR